jgi:hypothetical protein
MTQKHHRARQVQRARLAVNIGRHSSISASVRVTSGGLLAIAGLVSAVLLSTAVLVRTAAEHRG